MKRPKVTLPVDSLGEVWAGAFGEKGRPRVGALLHGASTTGRARPTLGVLEKLHGSLFDLVALFGPQHGFAGTTQDNMVEWQGYIHPRLGIPVYSLYGETREPTVEMLEGMDVLLVDLCDVGSRYYTFIWTLYLCMRACERAGVMVVVCDRPNPIGGEMTEGELPHPDYLSFVGMHPLPVRHGRTIGELAVQFRDEVFPGCRLEVLPMRGWERGMWFDQTGLAWAMPSPNMPTLDTATVYPGMCLLEGTNVSEGRGTTRPFELFGAPWVDGFRLAGWLNGLGLEGVYFREVSFGPTFQKYAGEVCHGCQIHVMDRMRYEPLRSGLEIIRVLRERYSESFAWKQPPYEYEHEKLPIEILLGGPVGDYFG